MLEGKSVKESAKRRILAGIKRAVFDLDGQSGSDVYVEGGPQRDDGVTFSRNGVRRL